MKVVVIIQARMGSTRLPGKALMDLAGERVLTRVVNRTRRAVTVDEVVVATTTAPADDRIVRLCEERGWPCFRGSEDDVLDRYYQAAVQHEADSVVRITSDCPLTDPEVIDKVVQESSSSAPEVDYVSNTLERTFPRGLDVEVVNLTAMEKAWQEDDNPAWREHVTPYVYRHPEIFRLRNVANDENLSRMRWTVDTAEDLAFVRRIYDHFKGDEFTWREVLNLLALHPEWLVTNEQVEQKLVP